ncbi:MAG: hypothetical protein IJB35_03335 [Oscillospiraceae bacterium]|nr:hypothetical protein [Oscillospiraceae bacterium]
MKIKLLHLYGDVMNLYGEYANVAILARYLKDLGHSVCVDTLSLYEEKDISDYDFYYMGAGTERKMKLMLPQLLKNRQVLCNACDEGKVLLFTGNACDVLGKSITDAEGLRHEALGIGSFETREEKTRINGDCIACFDGVQEELVGFINKCSWNTGVDTPLVSLRLGKGNEKDKPWDGFRRNNCLGTHLTGPLLAKNPAMLRYIAALITKEAVPLDIVSPFMIHGYEVTKRELLKRLEA